MNQLGNASGFRAKSFICIKGNDNKIMALGALEFEELGEILNELASGVGICFIEFIPENDLFLHPNTVVAEAMDTLVTSNDRDPMILTPNECETAPTAHA
jgi:GTPase SAR1 family protein